MKRNSSLGFATGVVLLAAVELAVAQGGLTFSNASGQSRTISTAGTIDQTGPFFQQLGTNRRACVSCHVPAEGWSISTSSLLQRFKQKDPIFALVDGANTPRADVSTGAARLAAYSMLLNHGVIRVERGIPTTAEFELQSADDPYKYSKPTRLSLFRRPLPATNLRFLSTVMWDGREVDTATPMTIANSIATNTDILIASLSHQAVDANNGHAQAISDLTPAQQSAIVNFETSTATAQITDNGAGSLTQNNAMGSPDFIPTYPFFIGINDNFQDPNGPFRPIVMTLFNTWANSLNAQQRSIARGQNIFNTKPILITNVKGLNDNPYFGSPGAFNGSCTTCHNTPQIGNHSLNVMFDLGLTDAIRRTPEYPLYMLRNKTTGATIQSTDPGLAMSTGKWSDIGRFKVPVLRGLAARAPYFHDGSAADLGAVVDFYRARFGFPLNPGERQDLINFLRAL